MSILSQTQHMLSLLIKERDAWRKERDAWKRRVEDERISTKMARQDANKYQMMYDSVAEPLERVSQYCGILPPKTLYRDQRYLSPYEKIQIYKPMKFEITVDGGMCDIETTFFNMQLDWVHALTEEYHHKLQRFQHFRLQFNDGKELAYSFSKDMTKIHNREFLMKEICELFTNAWMKEATK